MDVLVAVMKIGFGWLVLAVCVIVLFEVAGSVLRDRGPQKPAHDEYLDYLKADTELDDLAKAGRDALLERWLEGHR